jgi:CheY-like chemotaxis protein
MDEVNGKKALVVDDDATGRAFLRALLKRAGYVVDTANSGEEALEKFSPGVFEMVFMDIRMPGIDGIETTRRLKAAAREVFTPVIFVTGAGDEQSLVSAIRAGGDDFLVKPVVPEVLLAKLEAMSRIKAVHERTRRLYQRVMEDQHQALEVFDRSVAAKSVASPHIKYRIIPAEVFSGDLMLTAISPRGALHMLVGDFTGHGLAAALGAMPLADVFRASVEAGMVPAAILEQLNAKALDALPRGHFLAAALVTVDAAAGTVYVANCSLPPIYLCGEKGIGHRINSSMFPLGITADASYDEVGEVLPFAANERLVITTDGVSEAVNMEDEAFGESRLEDLLASLCGQGIAAPELVCAALDAFRGDTPFADDVSVVELSCSSAPVPAGGDSTRPAELEMPA